MMSAIAASSLPSELPRRPPFDGSDSVELDISPTSSVTESIICFFPRERKWKESYLCRFTNGCEPSTVQSSSVSFDRHKLLQRREYSVCLAWVVGWLAGCACHLPFVAVAVSVSIVYFFVRWMIELCSITETSKTIQIQVHNKKLIFTLICACTWQRWATVDTRCCYSIDSDRYWCRIW